MKRSLVSKLLMLLGFTTVATACDPDKVWGGQAPMYGLPFPAPEYGCPYAEFIFNTEVKDGETDTPIEGIRVSVVYRYDGISQVDTITTALTSADGKALLRFDDYPTDTHELVADDIDGEENGGDYNSASTIVKTSVDDFNGGDGNWDSSTATHNVTFSLTKK